MRAVFPLKKNKNVKNILHKQKTREKKKDKYSYTSLIPLLPPSLIKIFPKKENAEKNKNIERWFFYVLELSWDSQKLSNKIVFKGNFVCVGTVLGFINYQTK